MIQRKNASGRTGLPSNEDAWKRGGAGSEWEADTDVMPPEYSRQLLEISRLLEQRR